jgi:hypothetical protein
MGADDAGKEEDEPEEAEAVYRGDDALRLESAHRLEFGQSVNTEPKQARDIAQDEVDGENNFWQHLASCPYRITYIILSIQIFFE